MHKRPYLRRWPIHLPFDFEKLSKDEVAEVIFTALPEKELFAAIDDDHGQVNYSLISRGLYPNRLSREELKRLEFYVAAPPISRFRSLIPHTLRPVFRWGCSVLRRLRWSVDSVLRR